MSVFRIPLLSICLLSTWLLSAHRLIGRSPYQPAPEQNSAPPRLNPEYLARQLEPLLQVDIPDRIPAELQITAEQFDGWMRVKEANQHMVDGSPENALVILQDCLKKFPDAVEIKVPIADILFALGRYEEAEAAYLEALRQNPFHFQALNNLAWMQASMPDKPVYKPEKALQLANRARIIQPNSHYIWSTLSQTYYALGRYEEAQDAARRTLLLFRQGPGSVRDFIRYQVHLEKCQAAVQATSLLE